MMKWDVFNVRSDFNHWSVSGVDAASDFLSTSMTKRQPSGAQSDQACPTHLSAQVLMGGWWKCAESQRDWCVIIQSERQATIWNSCGSITGTLQASKKKKQSITSCFKNRKFTVDAGKMWPDCNGRLSYFNLRAVSTFFCDLLRSLMDCKVSVSPSRAQLTKPHLLWRIGLTSKQALDPHGPHV